ncbi:hypothetical protein SORBI_3002G400151 [Sorghum bicolor]|uniref:F-box domain-containing protein n=2 Tax=Sorghum bicolor TaxID=4558 RepID=A0A1W0W7R1_SORBI|nr:hypothetical protein SORBI_3002G400151 [Sorghum bicolor]OQU90383.1 hypothetical protein SORBI_3002G400151 [Sorghum bicolor]
MELNNVHVQQVGEDMISKLNDDVLLLILENVDLTMSVRAGALSTRWRHLPWLLGQLTIDMMDFLHEPYADPTVDDHIDKAMSSLAEAIRSMLSPSRRKTVVTRLCVSLVITNSYSSEIGHLVNEVVENGMVKDIELTSGVERIPGTVSDEEMEKHANDLHNLIANVCTELRYLYLSQCDTGFQSTFKIDAPNSKLNILELVHCHFAQVELHCLPMVEKVIFGFWLTRCVPLTWEYIPCLKEVEIFSAMPPPQEPFKLSDFLRGTTCINTLSLDFLGQKIWLLPEKHQLSSVFSNLRKLCIYDVFVGFGLLWTTALLEAAPSLEILEVEVYDHRCEEDEKVTEKCAERTNGPWQVSEFAYPKHSPLKELEIIGFNASEEHIVFIGAVMERASNLQSVVLKDKCCKECEATSTASVKRKFPEGEDEQELVVNKLRNRFFSRAQIIFSDRKVVNECVFV